VRSRSGGTVPFLFTEFEGSTALREDARWAMATAVNRYQLTVPRIAIRANGGAVKISFLMVL
jgi:hypothetical protein